MSETRYSVGRRAFDVGLALLLLPFALLLGALVALAIMVDSPGPVLFRARRVGRGGAPFDMLKFRTMCHPSLGPGVRCKDDERQTPLGRLLTLTRLDELPQLWNVLNGEMALVGPRPEVEEFVAAQAEPYERILSVPPGLTGPTQLEFADEGRLLAAAPDPVRTYLDEVLPLKVHLDLRYVESSSLRRDVATLVRTLLLPLRKTAEWASSGLERRARSRWEGAQLLIASVGAIALTIAFAALGASGP